MEFKINNLGEEYKSFLMNFMRMPINRVTMYEIHEGLTHLFYKYGLKDLRWKINNKQNTIEIIPIRNIDMLVFHSLGLPTKDEVISSGFQKATTFDYTLRRVCAKVDEDTYYSGWMDCYDWLNKKI